MNDDLLEFARAWKAGYTLRVHPTVGRRLNQALFAAHEDPRPFLFGCTEDAPTLEELLRRDEHARAGDRRTYAVTH